jgi:hypothetical protein
LGDRDLGDRDWTDAAVARGWGFLHSRRGCYIDLRVSKMSSQGPSQNDEEKGRVLPFRPRKPHSWNEHLRLRDRLRSPVEDLSKYSRDRGEDNFHHRMKVNMLAFAVLALIVACGIWLANTMAEMTKNQDCVLTGRTNCSPIRVPADSR